MCIYCELSERFMCFELLGVMPLLIVKLSISHIFIFLGFCPHSVNNSSDKIFKYNGEFIRLSF